MKVYVNTKSSSKIEINNLAIPIARLMSIPSSIS